MGVVELTLNDWFDAMDLAELASITIEEALLELAKLKVKDM